MFQTKRSIDAFLNIKINKKYYFNRNDNLTSKNLYVFDIKIHPIGSRPERPITSIFRRETKR